MLRTFLLSVACIVAMSACQSTLPRGERSGPDADGDATALLRAADRARTPGDAARLRVEAAAAFLVDNDAVQALIALADLNTIMLPQDLADSVLRTRAEAHLALAEFAAAEQALAQMARLEGADFLLLAEVCNRQSRYRCAADAYIQASNDIGYGAEQLPVDIHDRIWLALSRSQQGPGVFTDRYHQAWWLLQEAFRNAGSITGQVDAWQRWQARFPSHPARLDPPTALRRLQDYRMPDVALLLPLSGNLGGAGQAVRDGLIAAYLSEDANSKPRIRFYDSAAEDLAQTWERAIAGGADVVVGPLLKSQVGRFATLTEFSDVPRLMLNYLDESPGVQLAPAGAQQRRDTLFQIGIAIEDEAVSLANHVLAAGHKKILVVHSQDRWALRALSAFREQWPYPLTQAAFVDIKGLTGAVGEAMQVAASEARKNEIANILGEQLEFLPRARGDLDGIVALTSQVEAEALIPALRFHFADQLPVYATSQVARGNNTARLAGFRLTEMPVFVTPNAAQQQLTGTFRLAQNPYAELYALGFDAYRLATWLPILDAQTPVGVPAATGFLWLQPDGAFRRDLSLSRISAEGLVPLDE